VNVYYFHSREGFSGGIYVATGILYPLDWKFPAVAMVLDTKWVDFDHQCKEPAKLKEAWYVVKMPNDYILYGTGGVNGIVYITSQTIPERDIADIPCRGYGCLQPNKADNNPQ
jgi:hypothetical protein